MTKSFPHSIDLSTLIEMAPLLNLQADNKKLIRDQQDTTLANYFLEASKQLQVNHPNQCYLYGCLDFLVTKTPSHKQFHLIEYNGLGIGGLTNLPDSCLQTIFQELGKTAGLLRSPHPVVLMPLIFKLSESSLFFERLLVADSFKKGFSQYFPDFEVQIVDHKGMTLPLREQKPYFMIGNFTDILPLLNIQDNKLCFKDCQVDMIFYDQSVTRILNNFPQLLPPYDFVKVNTLFPLNAYKHLALNLFNSFIQQHALQDIFPEHPVKMAFTKDELITKVQENLKKEIFTVIKPPCSAKGQGIQFFLNLEMPEQDIISAVEDSLQTAGQFAGETAGKIFPYTLCPFIDSSVIHNPHSSFYNHKYELRIIVYRNGQSLQAVPSIAKIAGIPYNKTNPTNLMLLNNVSVTSHIPDKKAGKNILPLCNQETLQTLDITQEEMKTLCALSAQFIKYALEQEDNTIMFPEHAHNITV